MGGEGEEGRRQGRGGGLGGGQGEEIVGRGQETGIQRGSNGAGSRYETWVKTTLAAR